MTLLHFLVISAAIFVVSEKASPSPQSLPSPPQTPFGEQLRNRVSASVGERSEHGELTGERMDERSRGRAKAWISERVDELTHGRANAWTSVLHSLAQPVFTRPTCSPPPPSFLSHPPSLVAQLLTITLTLASLADTLQRLQCLRRAGRNRPRRHSRQHGRIEPSPRPDRRRAAVRGERIHASHCQMRRRQSEGARGGPDDGPVVPRGAECVHVCATKRAKLLEEVLPRVLTMGHGDAVVRETVDVHTGRTPPTRSSSRGSPRPPFRV